MSFWYRFLFAFGCDFGSLSVALGPQNRTQKRARAGPGPSGTPLGIDLARSKWRWWFSEALGVAFGPFLASILGHWASFWTLQSSIWDPPWPHLSVFGPIRSPGLGPETLKSERLALARGCEILYEKPWLEH